MRLIGFSTGALHRGDVRAGLGPGRRLALPVVELSALSEDELLGVEAALPEALSAFEHVVVHAPAKGRRMPEAELVARLDALGVPVVLHPYVAEDLSAWAPLGERLLVENSDGRKQTGQGPESLTGVFEVVPAARFCLDVSHALHAGGRDLLLALLAVHGDRVAHLHVGCSCGEDLGPHLDTRLLSATALALDLLPSPVPVVLERTVDPPDPAVLADLVAALRSLGP